MRWLTQRTWEFQILQKYLRVMGTVPAKLLPQAKAAQISLSSPKLSVREAVWTVLILEPHQSRGFVEDTDPALGSAHTTRSGLGWGWHQPTRPFSMHTVNMMILQTFCSHTSLQKSSMVFFRGPWVAMNSCWDV